VRSLIGGQGPTTGQAKPITTGASYPGGSDTGITTVSLPSGNKTLGRALAMPYGWGAGAQWTALDQLWTRESNWSNTAKNPSSGAYGIPQALPQTKMPHAAQESGGSSAASQIQWGLSYIASRYSNPVNAWAHEQTYGWY
jgi:hypothetical protein